MRISSLFGLLVSVCVASPVFAALSVNDLPYLQGTPIADELWEVRDYSQDGEGIHWVWLQQGGRSAYVVYPSEEAVLLPDNTLVSASTDQMTLRFTGETEQELLFTRFGNALFTLMGGDVQVRYTAVSANTAAGTYPGDLSMDAREIHMEGELLLDGNMALDAQATLGLYGSIHVGDQLALNAPTGVIIGMVENNGTYLDACGTHSAATISSIHIDTSLGGKHCFGDFLVVPESIPEATNLEVTNVQGNTQTSSKSKGGKTGGWLFALLVAVPFLRRRMSKGCAI